MKSWKIALDVYRIRPLIFVIAFYLTIFCEFEIEWPFAVICGDDDDDPCDMINAPN